MKNKVLLLGGYRLPQGNASAVRAFGNAKLLAQLGYEPIIVGKMQTKSDQCWHEYDGITCMDIECAGDRYGYSIEFMKRVEERVALSDMYAVIAYNFPTNAQARLRTYCKKHRIALVSDATEWYAFELVNGNLVAAVLRKLQTEYRMRILNKRIGHVICSTYFIADYYKKANTVVIPMIDDTSFSEDRRPCVSPVGTPRRFIYAGSPGFKFRKDKVNVIVEQFAKLKAEGYPFVLDIYGITEAQYKDVFAYSFENDADHTIRFHGRVPRDEIDRALTQSDFYVLYRPNDRVCKVGFSTKAMESISQGVPLIANDVNGDFGRYFTHNQALLCAPQDEEAFFALLKSAVEMPADAVEAMKRNCCEHNPFHYTHYLESVGRFMKEVGYGNQ